ncbi:DUF397 domain-containing protein [Streptomyces rapamycinicus]|uniref:DUF397 domain-containing protein n=2 Tax=Streptomyces rapamycinicus TaxID=1226757 RepID=A0A3L8RLB2_STRRN|nr:DUF397 domain-containing protein [Streptomyces rapamycinicus]MBB4783994.1 hypothetical protein [Streptomyces rapamycinicus]RLV80521.1 DUF397 domain-containing protein [Streptomyces rapamycinicus NRRL 5491]
MTDLKWRKSSFSTDVGAHCMELFTTSDGIRIRESDEPEAVIRTPPAALGVLIRAIKTGRLDRAFRARAGFQVQASSRALRAIEQRGRGQGTQGALPTAGPVGACAATATAPGGRCQSGARPGGTAPPGAPSENT